MPKAIALFSGGLDSLLAIKVVEDQGIQVVPITMVTPFFDGKRALELATKNGLCPIVMDMFDAFLPILKDPPHGYGDQMNPCVDCHILMFRLARSKMQELKADFVVTGEVLGQRPMSQNRAALNLIEKESGLKGLLLRPLSAKLLPPTKVETEGMVDRERLLAISGRSRKAQMELVSRFGIKDYATPAGGCLLTEPNYALRVKDLLAHLEAPKRHDFELLGLGRHFRLTHSTRLILGRDKRENEQLSQYTRVADAVLRCTNTPGPLGLLLGTINRDVVHLSSKILASYSDRPKVGATQLEVIYRGRGEIPELVEVKEVDPKGLYRPFLITAQDH